MVEMVENVRNYRAEIFFGCKTYIFQIFIGERSLNFKRSLKNKNKLFKSNRIFY